LEKAQTLLNKLASGEDSLSALALRLLSGLYQSRDSVLFSPAGVFVGLCSILNGAGAGTATQLREFLGLNASDQGAINEFCQAFSAQDSRPSQISVPTGVWLSRRLTISPHFQDAAREWYHNNLHICDFAEASLMRANLNKWAEQNTHGLISQVDIQYSASTDLVLISSMYMKALWQAPFDSVRKDTFHTAAGTKVEVEMMSVNETFRYSHSSDFQALQLPFRDPNLHMIIAIPAPNVSFQQMFFPHARLFEKSSYHIAPVHLEMPRFDLFRRYDLKAWLMSLGLTDVFKAGQADLNQLASPNVQLDGATHMSRLRIDQLGTEGAGVTRLGSSWGKSPAPKNSMIVNRPFFFAIVDSLYSQILYMGVIANPISSNPIS
jgi:serpin B